MTTERHAFEHAILAQRVASRFESASVNELLEIPADTSKRSLSGWMSGIESTLYSFPAGSTQRQHFMDEAVKQIAYLQLILRSKPALKRWLEERKTVIKQRLDSESD